MGYYIDGRHYRWGDPLALLAFPKLGLIDKLRYGLHMFLSTRRRDWSAPRARERQGLVREVARPARLSRC